MQDPNVSAVKQLWIVVSGQIQVSVALLACGIASKAKLRKEWTWDQVIGIRHV